MKHLAKWICHPYDGDENRIVPVFRKKFNVRADLKIARLTITSHGIFEAKINGKQVSPDKFAPGLTSYYYRIQAPTYDVTELLVEGENTWVSTVGDGWWRWNNNFGYRLALFGFLELEYADGSSEVIATDESFDVGDGPIVKCDLQKGETYDARRADGNFIKAIEETEYTTLEIIPLTVPTREKERFEGKLFKDRVGNLVADFGQNIAGYVKLRLHNTVKGQKIHIKHGEGLDKNGVFSTANCDGGMKEFQEITYICRGDDVEEYTPHFTYFGFRYAIIEGIDDIELTAIALYSDMEEVGDFKCSNPLINKLVENARWSQKGNFLDVPVDCPTRERNAWTGDAQIYVNTAAYFMNVEDFFKKWLVDQRLEQHESGKVGITFPSTCYTHNPEELKRLQKTNPAITGAGPLGNGSLGDESVGWGDSAVWLPYQLYLMYGDKTILEDHYETAKKWLDFSLSSMKKENPQNSDKPWRKQDDGEFIYDTNFHFGEWNEPLPPPPDVIALFMNGGTKDDFVAHVAKRGTPEVATAYTKRSCDNLSHMAQILGKEDDAKKYREISEKIKAAYSKYLISDEGVIQEGHQAAYIRALALGMVDDEKKPLVIKELKREIKAADYHLNTGFLSTVYLLPTLVDNGMTEEAFKILETTTLPGWLHPITLGATTMLENWNGLDVFRDSFNHYSFGAVCQFLFEYVGGIRPTFECPGFEKIILKPTSGGTLQWASAEYKSKSGLIKTEWRIENGVFYYSCLIPEKSSATLYLPSGKIHELGPGKYEFSEDV